MFVLGMLAVLQITLVPGLLVYRFYKFSGGFFYCLSSIFATSLIINFLLIYVLALIKLYTRPIFLVIFFLEIIALIFINRSVFKISLNDFSKTIQYTSHSLLQNLKEWISEPLSSPFFLLLRQFFQLLVLGLAFSLLIWFLKRLTNNIGSVFNTWDAVLAWNTWAQLWAQNQVTSHSLYPQLLPTNLSLTYLFMGTTEIVLFAKAIMPIFSILLVFTLFEQGIEQRETGYFIAVILSYLLIKKFTGDILTDGYADIPVMFMVFMAFNQILRNQNKEFNKKEFAIGLFFAAGAGLTKQVGLYCFVIFPIIYLFLCNDNKNKKEILLFSGIASLFLLTWYFPLIIKSIGDFGFTSLPGLTAIASRTYENVPLIQRALLAFLSLGKYLFLFLVSIPIVFILDKKHRLMVFLFIVPFSITWSIIASYDLRNLSITFPIVAIIVSVGFYRFFEMSLLWLSKSKISNLPAISFIFLLILGIVGMQFYFTNKRILAIQRNEQMKIFSPEINEQVYGLPFGTNGCEKIVTNYPVMYLPGLETKQINTYLEDFNEYKSFIEDKSICWMLVPNYANSLIKEDIQRRIESGTYELLYETQEWIDYQLIQIRH